MEYVIGITVVVVVLAVAVIWWLLNRRRASQAAAGTGPASAPAEEPAKDTEPSGEALSHSSVAGPAQVPNQAPAQIPDQAPALTNVAAPGPTPAPVPPVQPDQQSTSASADDAPDQRASGDRDEWETQWTDAAGTPTSPPSAGKAADPSGPRSVVAAGVGSAAADTPSTSGVKRAPAGHLSAKEPYGAGSASPGPDGSGPGGFTVKGDASAMVYYDESEAGYQEAACDVWFLSPAHAEAAGFREPRRVRR